MLDKLTLSLLRACYSWAFNAFCLFHQAPPLHSLSNRYVADAPTERHVTVMRSCSWLHSRLSLVIRLSQLGFTSVI